ncbi:GNAT family N-acetyltransferase [Pedobacter montanisoli]|uniref:GNAT family N-acetyltransferase n=1 Tax=Pedobacter montanisoli TaxID=2923277 RepID=A0ABS9ZYT2_9SPHI|nr:GNAT family N-acetyltransferase [Pedobacter montanisoli]MCJ0743481.1 GNAT family N-acetyltransferase [Pedobacter montanisoli]
MHIRPAKITDAEAVVNCVLLAMEEVIYQFIGENNQDKAKQFLTEMFKQKENQYSYENCWVVEENNQIIGAAIVYEGAKLAALREPVIHWLQLMFNRNFMPEDETQEGEFYIDCIGVNSDQQGRGIGTKLLQFLIDLYVKDQQQTLGLLVDQNNPQAKKLYLRSGFKVTGEKKLAGKHMEHLQLTIAEI